MDKRCSFLVLIGCLIERLPKTCVPSSKLCFVRLAIAKLTNFFFFIFWPVLDLCQVFRNLPTRKLQPCSSINFAGFPDCIPRWVCKSTDGHKQKFKNCTWKCRSKMSRDPHLASVFSGWPHIFWNLSYRRDCTFFSMQKRQGIPAKKKTQICMEKPYTLVNEFCDKKVRFIEICYYSRGICRSFSTTVVTVLHLTFGLLIEGTAVWAILRFAPEPVRLLLGAGAVGRSNLITLMS